MKRIIVLVFVGVFLFTGIATATLLDNLDGTITQTRNDGSRLMWLKNANLVEASGYDDTLYGYDTGCKLQWQDAVNWADQLEFAGYNDWRLFTLSPVQGTSLNLNLSYDGSTDMGYNNTSGSNEIAHLYDVELENVGKYDTSGNLNAGWENKDFGPFLNVEFPGYWIPILSPPGYGYPDNAMYWHMGVGAQEPSGGITTFGGAWAVRDMDPVPEPTTILLLSTGLIGLAGTRRRLGKK